MAIDSTLFAADIPAGTYAAGDVIPLVNIDGPANVRSGRGAAKLKSVFTAVFASGAPYWKVVVKNSDWIDPIESYAGLITAPTIFDEESGGFQSGHDCDLTPNSGWQVYAVCVTGGTSTVANSLCCLIDVDYPQVGGVTNPRKAVGFPTSIAYDKATVPIIANGGMVASTWTAESVDYFKAGFKYVLDAVEFFSSNTNATGFIAFSNAAGMGGLQRIIPITATVAYIRYSVKYSSVLQKGPMDVKFKLFAGTAGTASITTVHDYVKQKA